MKVILTGATGYVGQGVLLESLENTQISEVLVVGRKPCGILHPRLREILVKDFMNLSSYKDEWVRRLLLLRRCQRKRVK